MMANGLGNYGMGGYIPMGMQMGGQMMQGQGNNRRRNNGGIQQKLRNT